MKTMSTHLVGTTLAASLNSESLSLRTGTVHGVATKMPDKNRNVVVQYKTRS